MANDFDYVAHDSSISDFLDLEDEDEYNVPSDIYKNTFEEDGDFGITDGIKRINYQQFIYKEKRDSNDFFNKFNLGTEITFKESFCFDIDGLLTLINGSRNIISTLPSSHVSKILTTSAYNANENKIFDLNIAYNSFFKNMTNLVLKNTKLSVFQKDNDKYKQNNVCNNFLDQWNIYVTFVPLGCLFSMFMFNLESSSQKLNNEIKKEAFLDDVKQNFINISNLKFKQFVLNVCIKLSQNNINILKKRTKINNGSFSEIRKLEEKLMSFKIAEIDSVSQLEDKIVEFKTYIYDYRNKSNLLNEMYNSIEDLLRNLLSDKIVLEDKTINLDEYGLRFFESCSKKETHEEIYSFIKDYVLKNVCNNSKILKLEFLKLKNIKLKPIESALNGIQVKAEVLSLNSNKKEIGISFDVSAKIFSEIFDIFGNRANVQKHVIDSIVGNIIAEIFKLYNKTYVSYAKLNFKYKSLLQDIDNYNDCVESFSKGTKSLNDVFQNFTSILVKLHEYIDCKNNFRISVLQLSQSLNGNTIKSSNAK